MHRGCFVWTPTPPLAGWRTPRPGPARVCVCLLFLAGSGRPTSRARSGAPLLFLWPLWLSALLGRSVPCVFFFFFFSFPVRAPGLFKFRADPVEPWITIKSPNAAIWSRGKRNNLAVNIFCLAQSHNCERRPSCLASQRRFLGNVASWAQGTFRKGRDQKQTAKVRGKLHCSNSGYSGRQTDSKSASPYAFTRQARGRPISPFTRPFPIT